MYKFEQTGRDMTDRDKTQQDSGKQTKDSRRRYCQRCKKEIFPSRRCVCIGGGGGDDSGEQAGKDDGIAPANAPDQTIDKVGQVANATIPAIDKAGQVANATIPAIDSRDLSQQLQLNEKIFNPKIISELLSNRLLVIDNNRELGILTIKLQYNPSLLAEEQRSELNKFINAILKELDEFQKEQGILTNCATINKDDVGNVLSLRITLPRPTVYNAFIDERLASKNLLPTQNKEQQEKEKVVYPEGMNHFNPTPLSMKLTHAMNKGAKPTDEEKHETDEQGTSKKAGKSSSIRPGAPSDGPKPKGWE